MKKKLLNIVITFSLIILVFFAVTAFGRYTGSFDVMADARGDYLAVLGIMYSVIFITTSLLATLSNKDDVVYYENATDYVLINPPVFNFFGLSVMSYIVLAAATVSVVTGWTEVFITSFVLGIGFVIILFFKMTTIYFRRSRIRDILFSDFMRDVDLGRTEEAREKINHLYLNSLKSVDRKNFDICIENLEFLQEAEKCAEIREYCVEVIKKLLVQISSSDLFYFTRVMELFQDDRSHESFLKITSMRHYVAQLLIDRVVNENDAVTLMSLYSIYVRETVEILRKMSDDAAARISEEKKEIHKAMYGEYVIADADPDYYSALFREIYGDISEECALLAEVMVLYEKLDTSWTERMDEICALPDVLSQLWELEKQIDYTENPFRNELRSYRHFIEEYVRSAVSRGRSLNYFEVLRDRAFEQGDTHDIFEKDTILINDRYDRSRPDTDDPSYREITLNDFGHKGVCETVIRSSDRSGISELLRWLPESYCDIIGEDPGRVGDTDYDDEPEGGEETPVTGRLRDDYIWMLTRMISLRNSVGICSVLRKITADVSDYNYYLYGIYVLSLDGMRSFNILSKIKNFCNVSDASVKEELKAYIDSAQNVFVNNMDF